MAQDQAPQWFAAELPVKPADLNAIEGLIAQGDLLIPGNFRMSSAYGVLDYLESRHRNGREFRAFFDRNLVTRIVGLARGDPMPLDPESKKIVRYSAACIAFCILAEIGIEPGLALYEGASAHGHEQAASEHRLFRIADHVDPTHYVDIALGRRDAIPVPHLLELAQDQEISAQVCREPNFSKPLNLWKPNYLYLLKTAELRRAAAFPALTLRLHSSSGKPKKRFTTGLRHSFAWLH